MRHIYAFETIEEYSKHQNRIKHFSEKLKWYQEILEKEFSLKDPPKAVVWTTDELATNILSDKSIHPIYWGYLLFEKDGDPTI